MISTGMTHVDTSICIFATIYIDVRLSAQFREN